MANVSAGDTILCTFVGSVLNQTILNTFGFVCDSMTVPTAYETITDEIEGVLDDANKLIAKFLLCQAADYTLEQVWLQRLYPTRLYKRVYVQGTSGGLASDQGTPNVAAAITRRGGLGTRNNVSTLHVMVPATLGNIVDGAFTTGLKTALDNLALEILQPIATTSGPGLFTPCILQGTPGATAAIIQTTTQLTPRVMRRRTVGVGI